MKHWVAGAALTAALLPFSAQAVTEKNFGVRTTEDLVALCSATPSERMGTAALNFCDGFAQGAVDVEFQRDTANRQPKPFCFPNPTPPRRETLSEFVKWARANPARL